MRNQGQFMEIAVSARSNLEKEKNKMDKISLSLPVIKMSASLVHDWHSMIKYICYSSQAYNFKIHLYVTKNTNSPNSDMDKKLNMFVHQTASTVLLVLCYIRRGETIAWHERKGFTEVSVVQKAITHQVQK